MKIRLTPTEIMWIYLMGTENLRKKLSFENKFTSTINRTQAFTHYKVLDQPCTSSIRLKLDRNRLIQSREE